MTALLLPKGDACPEDSEGGVGPGACFSCSGGGGGATLKAEAGGLQIWGQPGWLRETLPQKIKRAGEVVSACLASKRP